MYGSHRQVGALLPQNVQDDRIVWGRLFMDEMTAPAKVSIRLCGK
jgi:hypothetical protein